MSIGSVESLWRYPVKSMCGEELSQAFLGFSGIYGDRLFAFTSSSSPQGFPYLTGREHRQLLLYRPRFRHPERAESPPNLAEAEGIAPGLNPVFATPEDLAIDVETPTGELLPLDGAALIDELAKQLKEEQTLRLRRSERGMADCRPVSLFSVQTARQLGEEVGAVIDKRRFRANVYLDLEGVPGFAEDSYVGARLRIGPRAVVHVLERDPRCAMITIDPDTAERDPAIQRHVSQGHGGMAGVYAAVLVEGTVRPGDEVELLP
jgi:uncharacterized protein YcbX